MKGGILDEKDLIELKSIIFDLIKETKNEIAQCFNSETDENKLPKISIATNLLQKHIKMLDSLSKIEYKPSETEKEEKEITLADMQIMARTLAKNGMTILRPKNSTEKEDLIYRTVEYINPIVNGVECHLPTQIEVFGDFNEITEQSSEENSELD